MPYRRIEILIVNLNVVTKINRPKKPYPNINLPNVKLIKTRPLIYRATIKEGTKVGEDIAFTRYKVEGSLIARSCLLLITFSYVRYLVPITYFYNIFIVLPSYRDTKLIAIRFLRV